MTQEDWLKLLLLWGAIIVMNQYLQAIVLWAFIPQYWPVFLVCGIVATIDFF